MRPTLYHAAACAAVSALFALPAIAAEGTPKPAAAAKAGAPAHETQQERMRRCNATAKDKALKGDDRRAFMSTCLKG